MTKKVLIIGAGSFLARNLKKDLQDNGYKVSEEANDFLSFNSLTKTAKEKLIENDLIVASGVESIAESWRNPKDTLESQFLESLKILCFLKEIAFKNRIIFVGSGEEYGLTADVSKKINENFPLNPLNIYGASKACQTLFAKLFEQTYNLDIVVARCFNEVGVGQDDKFFISYLCKKVAMAQLKGLKEIKIPVGNLLVKRGFIDVRDITCAIRILLKKGRKGEIYNIGTETGIELLEVVNLLSRISGLKIICEADSKKFRPLDSPELIPSTQKIKNDTDWDPVITIQKTIEDMYDFWLREHKDEEEVIVY